jgi:hypothetical protein
MEGSERSETLERHAARLPQLFELEDQRLGESGELLLEQVARPHRAWMTLWVIQAVSYRSYSMVSRKLSTRCLSSFAASSS